MVRTLGRLLTGVLVTKTSNYTAHIRVNPWVDILFGVTYSVVVY